MKTKEGFPLFMQNRKKPRRASLGFKLNITTIIVILIVAAGIMGISYGVYCSRVDSIFFRQAEENAADCAGRMPGETIRYFIECINSDAFREVHEKAKKENDPELVLNWMKETKNYYYSTMEEEYAADVLKELDEKEQEQLFSLYSDYKYWTDSLSRTQTSKGSISPCLQYIRDGKAYYIDDPHYSELFIGTEDTETPDLSKYPDNAKVPATMYESPTGWRCTAFCPIVTEDTGEAVAVIGIDIDMDELIRTRRAFIVNSIVLVVLLTVISIYINLFLIRKIAVNPIVMLTKATCGFAREHEGYTRDDVIDVDIYSRDEIYDLYQEIRNMQMRIVDYTDDIARYAASKERMDTELRLASAIQSSTLPTEFPERSDLKVFGSMVPAKEVGGDFYDFFTIDENHVGFVIADVSGKGVPGALFMMGAMLLVKDRAMTGGKPSEVLRVVNEQMMERNRANMFVSVWLGILDTRTGVMTCANAGHEYPVLRDSSGLYELFKDKHGLVLGGLKSSRYTDYELLMEPGSAVYVYTDGITEARNSEEEFYGTQRLLDALNENGAGSPEEICRAVSRSVESFVGTAEQFDDKTMLCIVYQGNGDDHRTEAAGG